MSTPYLTPAQLTTLPTGINWAQIPRTNATAAEQQAAQLDLVWQATRWVDTQCGMPVRCTSDTEQIGVNGYRAAVRSDSVLVIQPRRWPVLAVANLQVRPAQGNATTWVVIAASDILPILNAGSDELAAGIGTREVWVLGHGVPWRSLPDSYVAQLTYTNGWPHGGLTASAAVGATTLTVDASAGWTDLIALQTTYQAELPDGGATEVVTVTAATANNDGTATLTLSAGLANQHAAGIICTTLPRTLWLAAGFYAAHLALRRGSYAIAVPPLRGNGGGGKLPASPDSGFLQEAQDLLAPYRRVY